MWGAESTQDILTGISKVDASLYKLDFCISHHTGTRTWTRDNTNTRGDFKTACDCIIIFKDGNNQIIHQKCLKKKKECFTSIWSFNTFLVLVLLVNLTSQTVNKRAGGMAGETHEIKHHTFLICNVWTGSSRHGQSFLENEMIIIESVLRLQELPVVRRRSLSPRGPAWSLRTSTHSA